MQHRKQLENIMAKLRREQPTLGRQNKSMDVCTVVPNNSFFKLLLNTQAGIMTCHSTLKQENGEDKHSTYTREDSIGKTTVGSLFLKQKIAIKNDNPETPINIPPSTKTHYPKLFEASDKIYNQWSEALAEQAKNKQFAECEGSLEANHLSSGPKLNELTTYKTTIRCALRGKSLPSTWLRTADHVEKREFNADGERTFEQVTKKY